MGLRKKSIETVSQVQFIETTQVLLDEAKDPSTDLDKSVGNAKSVLTRLGDIAAGKLEVRPPLDHTTYAGFQESAQTIESIGQRALDALAETAHESEAAMAQASEATPSFSGTGSDGKS
jgi:hypothetical protein